MKKKDRENFLVYIPIVSALVSAFLKSIWLIPVTAVLIFGIVAILPFCHKRESLWLFVLCTLSLTPMNFFILHEYPVWEYFLYCGSDKGVIYYLALFEVTLIATSLENVVVGVFGRGLWRRQYRLYIPEDEDEEVFIYDNKYKKQKSVGH